MRDDASEVATSLLFILLLAACSAHIKHGSLIISEHIGAAIHHREDSGRFPSHLAKYAVPLSLTWGCAALTQILLQAALLVGDGRLLGFFSRQGLRQIL